VEGGYFSAMSKIEEIEQAVEQLPPTDFVRLAVWVDQRRQQLAIFPVAGDKNQARVAAGRGEWARELMGAGRRWLKLGADPVGDLIREREQDDKLDQNDERQEGNRPF
jgi:hypothetical protein